MFALTRLKRALALILLLPALLQAPASAAPPVNYQTAVLAAPKSPLRLVAQRGEVAYTTINASASTNMTIDRSRHYFGSGDVTQMSVVLGGYWASSTPGEQNLGNTQTIQIALELVTPGAQEVQFTFSGATTVVVANGATAVVSDPIYPRQFGLSVFPANSLFYIREEVTVSAAGRFLSTSAGNAGAGDITLSAPSGSASQVAATGAPTTGGGWALTTNNQQMPMAFIGYTTTPQPSLCVVGDSVIYGTADAYGDGDPAGGAMKRALADSGVTRHVAYSMIATPSTTATDFVTGGKRMALLQYCSTTISDYGTNDAAAGRTVAQLESDTTIIANAVHQAGGRYYQLYLYPRTTTSTNWRDAAGQTPFSGFETGGNFRDPFKVWVDTHSEVVDGGGVNILSFLQDATFPDRWISDGGNGSFTSDGVHPTFHAVLNPVATLKAWVQSLKAPGPISANDNHVPWIPDQWAA